MALITMTRELGTLGKDVAAGLAQRLGLEVVHHELIEQGIAERAGMRESEVHRFLEGDASLMARWRIDRKKLSRYTAQEIFELAVKGNVLIRGWGATYLLRCVPHAVSVRVCAPMLFRERELMERMSISDSATAEREIKGNDAAHNLTMQRMFGIEWTDATHYAIVLNTDRVAVSDCVNQVVLLAESDAYRETPQSRAILMDQLMEARVRAALGEQFDASVMSSGIGVQVKDGKAFLSGALSDEQLIADIVQRVRQVDGIVAVDPIGLFK